MTPLFYVLVLTSTLSLEQFVVGHYSNLDDCNRAAGQWYDRTENQNIKLSCEDGLKRRHQTKGHAMSNFALIDAIRWDASREPPVLQVMTLRRVENGPGWWGSRQFHNEVEWVDVPITPPPPKDVL